ncbi:MAG: beta-galactosidase, partial [Lachnospiraceae bacterium]|nr:beta-galactosidase [Lachnospiraceae bacterium]
PYKSVDAMANIKMGSGCNFLGYYMFQGGSNPLGKHGTFMNEAQVPKISYDYQAALGEFGQVRESYRRLKSIHYFTKAFGDRLCPLGTVLPEGASEIDPRDRETLRYAVRTDGKRGFVFVNNFQDHLRMPDRSRERILLKLKDEEIAFDFGFAGEENAVLPFHFDMDGIDLVSATAQPVTVLNTDGERIFVFMAPEGMRPEFCFEEGVSVYENAEGGAAVNDEGKEKKIYIPETGVACFRVKKGNAGVRVLVISRELANQMYVISNDRLVFTAEALLEDENGLRLESVSASSRVYTFPETGVLEASERIQRIGEHPYASVLGCYLVRMEEKVITPKVTQVGEGRYTIALPDGFMDGLKDVRLQLSYSGDIGQAFIDGRLIHDNFANGAVWEIGLKDFEKELADNCVTVYITPLREGVNVNVESAMAARREEVNARVSILHEVRAVPVYERTL